MEWSLALVVEKCRGGAPQSRLAKRCQGHRSTIDAPLAWQKDAAGRVEDALLFLTSHLLCCSHRRSRSQLFVSPIRRLAIVGFLEIGFLASSALGTLALFVRMIRSYTTFQSQRSNFPARTRMLSCLRGVAVSHAAEILAAPPRRQGRATSPFAEQ